MSTLELGESEIERLLEEFRTYDRNVDIVSAWEFLCEVPLHEDVRHFERFPSVSVDGNFLTPDFTVLFHDGGGLVAELARFPLIDEGVDGLCRQLSSYDNVREIPGPTGLHSVTEVDLMLIVPMELGTPAVDRIIHERYAKPEHWYCPSAAPIIVQVALDQDKYVFQRLPDPLNGQFRDDDRNQRLSTWFARNAVPVRPDRFKEIKAARAFINDPIPELYLATFLWAKTFPVLAAAEPVMAALEVTPAGLAERLRREHGKVRANDVERALRLLGRAGLAAELPSEWIVEWRELRPRGAERELAELLARRAVRPPRLPRTGIQSRQPEPLMPPQERLFP